MKEMIEQLPILKDFQIYLEHCAKNNPKVTKSRQHLNRKSLYELNQQIHFQQEDAHARSDQPAYHALTFYYHLALQGRLLEFDYSRKTVTKIKTSEHFRFFADLSPTAQYVYLVKTYWLYCDWEEIPKDRRRIFSRSMDNYIQTIANQPVNQPIIYRDIHKFGMDTWGFDTHHFYWQCLGWYSSVNFIKRHGFYHFDGATTTELGQSILSILAKKTPYSDWNQAVATGGYTIDPLQMILGTNEDEDEIFELPDAEAVEKMSEAERNAAIQTVFQQMQKMVGDSVDIPQFMAEMKTQSEEGTLTSESLMQQLMERIAAAESEVKATNFEHFFADYFSEEVPNLQIVPEAGMVAGHYTFKIASQYHTKFWRTVKVDAQHTLHDLHGIIQSAIQFDDNHLYSFFMDNKLRSKFGYHSPFGMERPMTNEVKIGELGWREGQRVLYLFDYGDGWEFTVELVKHEATDEVLASPTVVESKGDAPKQYAGW